MSRSGSKLLRVELEVKVYDRKGRLIAERRKEGDLILNNFKDMLAGVLNPFEELASGDARKAYLVNLTGTTYDLAIWGNATVEAGDGFSFTSADVSPTWPIGVRIRIGTSTVAPTRNDYKLGAEVAYATPTRTVGADYISLSASITLVTAADIAEAGLSSFYQRYLDVPAEWYEFLLFRDTFTPISVPAGGTISITYKVTL